MSKGNPVTSTTMIKLYVLKQKDVSNKMVADLLGLGESTVKRYADAFARVQSGLSVDGNRISTSEFMNACGTLSLPEPIFCDGITEATSGVDVTEQPTTGNPTGNENIQKTLEDMSRTLTRINNVGCEGFRVIIRLLNTLLGCWDQSYSEGDLVEMASRQLLPKKED